MKCAKHNAEATAVCVYCGRALCADCAPSATARRMVCSDACGAAVTKSERALELILEKSLQSARAAAVYCYLGGAISAAAAVAAWYMLPSPYLIYFTGACAVALISSGIWYSSIARKTKL